MTGQVESLHATHHHKHEAGAHVIDYARGFGNTVKEGLKRTTQWAAHYITNKKSYYPVPSNSIRFWNISFLPPLPIVQMDEKDQERMKEWAHNNKKKYHDENQVDEYSDRSDSSDSEIDIDNERGNFNFPVRFSAGYCKLVVNGKDKEELIRYVYYAVSCCQVELGQFIEGLKLHGILNLF
ncbi:hypothetical protein pdam_00021795 [Pocillopora damicornis]|uniref:Uncharacterized protein n=1 Tax=Pocillopora damicornis TaxID=46731 RepID=A0A3M6UNM9_POCDA|nr:hypothetical protein pdam_00021795 [Pocillopora damicornis]